jgi:hypothetical protein
MSALRQETQGQSCRAFRINHNHKKIPRRRTKRIKRRKAKNQKGKEMKKTYVVQRNTTPPPEPADWQEMIWTRQQHLAKEWLDWQQDYDAAAGLKYNYRIVTMVPTIE